MSFFHLFFFFFKQKTAYEIASCLVGSEMCIRDSCDADFAGDRVDRRSTSGLCCFLGKSLNVWSSKKQPTVALSTAEAELSLIHI